MKIKKNLYEIPICLDIARLLSGSLRGCATSARISATKPSNLNEINIKKGNTCKSSQFRLLAVRLFFLKIRLVPILAGAIASHDVATIMLMYKP